MTATLNVNGVELQMEVDTGASASIISQTTYQKSWPTHAPPLQPSNVKLRTYTGEELKVLGSLTTEVQYLNQKARLHLLVVAGSGPSLLGRDWLAKIHLDWQNLQQLHTVRQDSLQDILAHHANVFNDELGLVKQTGKIHIDPKAKPRFYKPRTVPYAFRAKVEQELDRLEKAGIIEWTQFSNWAAPIVLVLK